MVGTLTGPSGPPSAVCRPHARLRDRRQKSHWAVGTPTSRSSAFVMAHRRQKMGQGAAWRKAAGTPTGRSELRFPARHAHLHLGHEQLQRRGPGTGRCSISPPRSARGRWGLGKQTDRSSVCAIVHRQWRASAQRRWSVPPRREVGKCPADFAGCAPAQQGCCCCRYCCCRRRWRRKRPGVGPERHGERRRHLRRIFAAFAAAAFAAAALAAAGTAVAAAPAAAAAAAAAAVVVAAAVSPVFRRTFARGVQAASRLKRT